MKIILASASPRRKELLQKLNIPFEIKVIEHEEVMNDNLDYYENCMNIAYNKALLTYEQEKDDVIVIGSDTMVLKNNKVYGKPKDQNDAFEVLKELQNDCHEVITSIVLLIRKNKQEYLEKDYSVSKIYIDKMSDSEIHDWIDNNDVLSKAGGYAIQEDFMKYVTKIDGDLGTIIGLPLNKTYRLLKKYLDSENKL